MDDKQLLCLCICMLMGNANRVEALKATIGKYSKSDTSDRNLAKLKKELMQEDIAEYFAMAVAIGDVVYSG